MTRREDGEEIICTVLCTVWHVGDPDRRGTVNEDTARWTAKAVVLELQNQGFLIAELDEHEIENQIMHAIAKGNFPYQGTLNPSPNECKTRIYSALENANALIQRV